MLTHDQADQLDRFEQALDNEYKNKKEAIRFMREFLSASISSSSNPNLLQGVSVVAPLQSIAAANGHSNSDLPPLDIEDGPTLIGKVSEVMEKYSQDKWTMRRMLAYLQQIKFPIKNAKPEASVSAALSKLSKSGRILVIRPGTGKTQGVYQWNANYVPSDRNEELAEDTEEEGDTVHDLN